MDFIIHDETPLFYDTWQLSSCEKRTPEVLTDVALLCVESNHNLHKGGKYKTNFVHLISI
ncbi:hypothetical protein D1174_22365 [Enterobacter cloacae]|nr:hypothetical protein D1174_22365 [Enterobacter cloacae]MPS83909.1 hypothetical protein [Enterobacter sp.]PPV38458.1 hypothetical protein C4L14_15515 [Enterobacter sp. RC4]MBD9065143.1 hypothetical protein [Enterobacter cloacae]QCC92790.1 hypothetical protein E7735_18350 [Enterobacter cloacae]